MLHFIGVLPHRKLRDLVNKYGPFMYLQLSQIPTVIISSPKAAQKVMKTHDATFTQRPVVLVANIIAYGCTDIVFAPYRSIREEKVSNLVRWISSRAGRTINLSKEIYSMTFGITTRAAFGGKMKDQEAFLCAIEEGIDLAGGFTAANVFPSFEFIDSISGVKSKIKEIHDIVDRLFDAIINEHKSRRATRKTNDREVDDDHKDFLNVLLNLQNNGDHEFTLSNDNIKAVIMIDFNTWKKKMKALLSHNKVGIALEKDDTKWPEEKLKKKVEVDKEAYNLIIMNLSNTVL
ncbi:cytochrome P450 71D11-like [Pistacia vera]|uniref:cytochrome P450 71D11-like n=1 Tax=Pistacia vera TaxID=55513 RepID=UPI001262ADB6|nr:cytochrome P450 71D11-like [Pistacia vera]